MAYTPNPYSDARAVSRDAMRGYLSIDVVLELPDPDDADAEHIEHDLTMFYHIQPEERDVGIMSPFVDEYFYCLPDGGIPPEDVWYALDTIEAREGDYRSPYVNPAMQKWHDRNVENAQEASSQPDYED